MRETADVCGRVGVCVIREKPMFDLLCSVFLKTYSRVAFDEIEVYFVT